MPPRYGISPWITSLPASRRPAFPVYKGDGRATVVIIGAGLTGCATAYACASSGLKPVVLEAARVGAGATAFGAGLLLPDPGPSFRDVVHAHGLRAGRRVFTAWRRAALDAASLLRRLHIRCGLTALDSVHTAHVEAEKILRREYEARVDGGFDLDWLPERRVSALTRTAEACAFRQSGAFWVDPYRAALGLASAARSRGAVFHEGTAVKKIRAGRHSVEVVTDRGTVAAATVVVTTGAPTALFAPLRRHFQVRDTYMVLTDVMPVPVRRLVSGPGLTIRDAQSPPHRLLRTDDHRILLAGAEQAEAPLRTRDGLVRHWTFELMYELLKMYPVISGLQPAFGWRLSSAAPRDGLPLIGPHRNYPRHLFALGGSAGESVTGAFLAARVLVRALDGSPDGSDDVFGFTR